LKDKIKRDEKGNIISIISYAVQDNPQQVELDYKKQIIKVTTKIGRTMTFNYQFKLKDYLEFGESFNDSYNRMMFLEEEIRKLNLKWFDFENPFFHRIIWTQFYAIEKILGGEE
jgi:hypothetical protein